MDGILVLSWNRNTHGQELQVSDVSRTLDSTTETEFEIPCLDVLDMKSVNVIVKPDIALLGLRSEDIGIILLGN